jgi:hypothetical protein
MSIWYKPKPNAPRCIVLECKHKREAVGNICARHSKHEARTGSAHHAGLSHEQRLKYRKPIRLLINRLLREGDFQTELMLSSVRLFLCNDLPKSLPAIDQAAYHSYDTRAAVIWKHIVWKKFKRAKQRSRKTEMNLALQVVVVAMAAHLAAEEVTTTLPLYRVVQVAQGINRMAFLKRPLQSKATSRRLYAAVYPLYKYWLESHREKIVRPSSPPTLQVIACHDASTQVESVSQSPCNSSIVGSRNYGLPHRTNLRL